MKIPYGYVLGGEGIAIHEEKADVVRSIFGYYLAGASLGKIVYMLFAKGISSPTGNTKWTRAAVDKLLANKKYIPIVGISEYMDAQFEKDCRCNVDAVLTSNHLNVSCESETAKSLCARENWYGLLHRGIGPEVSG